MKSYFKTKILKYLKNELSKVNTIGDDVILGDKISVSGSSLLRKVTVRSNSKIYDSIVNGEVILGYDNYVNKTEISGNFQSGQNCKFYGSTITGNISIGDYSSLWGPNLDIVTGNQKVTIGNFCSIARNVSMQTYNHNSKKITSYFIGQNLFDEKWENEKVSKGNITIENDVWIGAHCVVLGGVTIANGAVVAANSVVIKDVPAFSIVAGSPAKVIGYRFDNETVDKIQKMAWWDWSIEEIKQNKSLFEEEINNFN
jgi:acetyltransferase-like isoleucine patch superfamily enzyme